MRQQRRGPRGAGRGAAGRLARLAPLVLSLAACAGDPPTGGGDAGAPGATPSDVQGGGPDGGGGAETTGGGDAAAAADIAGVDAGGGAGGGDDASDASPVEDAERGATGPALDGPFPYPLLSDYRLFAGDPALQDAGTGVLAYEVAAPLWSDNASKHRFIVLPPGGKAVPHATDVWELPVGTILVKSFGFRADLRAPKSAERLVETRLLIHEETTDGPEWIPHVYLWSEDQTHAERFDGGTIVQVSYTGKDGAPTTVPYVVPNTNQCIDCHALSKVARPIGITTRQLARQIARGGKTVDQLAWLASQGATDGVATGTGLTDPYGPGDLEARARSWLDANCSHCHREGGEGGPSGLSLMATVEDPTSYGICKSPVAAGPGTGGKLHDIVPGDPDASILVHRIQSTDPAVKMPEIPNLLTDDAGVALIRQWIAAMPPQACGAAAP